MSDDEESAEVQKVSSKRQIKHLESYKVTKGIDSTVNIRKRNCVTVNETMSDSQLYIESL